MTRPVIPVVNPATGEHIKDIPMTSPEEIAAIRAEMGRVAPIWAQKPLNERIRILRQFQKAMVDAVDEITATINQDSGKTRQDALVEVIITTNALHDYLRRAPRVLREHAVSSGIYYFKKAYVKRRPYGVVAVIGPWNYPWLLTLQPVLKALLAGNAVILKPSEETSLVGQKIEALFNRVPELAPFVRVVYGDGRIGAALVESKPDMIFLTGSTRTGQLVAKAAAEHLIPVRSELGGKDPLIVLDDADVEAAAKWGVWSACFNAGQTCMATERVYVVESVYDEFVRHAVHYAQQFREGYTADVESPYSMGPLSTERQVAIIDAHLQDARDKGATVLTGGQRRGRYIAPTVVVDVDPSMLLLREETFGPIMPIVKVRDEDEAVRLANGTDYGLSAYVWSRNLDRAQTVADRLNAGVIVINDVGVHYAMTHLPIGGVKKSGHGHFHGGEDLLQFTHTHGYVVSQPPLPFDPATQMRYPGHYWLGKLMLKTLFGVSPAQKIDPVRDWLASPTGKVIGRTVTVAAVGSTLATAVTFLVRTIKTRR